MGVLKQWLPYVLSGISAGGQYALIAVGYTMVYGILRLINFAHGDIFMVAGLIMVYLSATMPLYFALPVVVILTVALGFAVERCAYKPLRQAPRMSVMISAIGVSYLLQNLAYYVTGGVPKQYPELPWISDTITILGASTKRVTVITPILTLALVFAFPVYFPTALLTEFASLLGYHAYLKMRYLLPMHYGAAALLIVLAVGVYFLADSLAGKNGQNEQKEKIRA